MCMVIAQETPIARKDHRCHGCEGMIEAGTLYVRQRVVDGREAWTWKAHPACDQIVAAIQAEYQLDCTEPIDPAEVRACLEDMAS